MGLISVTLPSDGTTIDAADYNTPITTIVNAINGNISTDNIATNSVALTKLTTDSSWAWTAWTPSWTNFTLGNGTLTFAKYVQIGKTVYYKIYVTLGSTSSVTGQITFSLPITAKDSFSQYECANGNCEHGSGVYYSMGGVLLSATTIQLHIWGGSTYLNDVVISSTVPFTWASTDSFSVQGFYEAA